MINYNSFKIKIRDANTPKKTLEISFDGGITFEEYNKLEAMESGIAVPDDLDDFSKIVVGARDTEESDLWYEISSEFLNSENVSLNLDPRIKKLEIPDTVTTVPENALAHCTNLTDIFVPRTVTNIGEKAFEGCENIKSVEIPNTVTSIGDSAFFGCEALESVEIPDSVTSIGSQVFQGCTALEEVIIPDSVTAIGAGAFSGCTSLTTVSIPDSVIQISGSAFTGSNVSFGESDDWVNLESPDGNLYRSVNYTVRHLLQENLDKTQYTPQTDEQVTLRGIVGTETQAVNKNFNGYFPRAFDQKAIAVNNTVVDLKYDVKRAPTGFVDVKGKSFDGTETWTPSSNVFISGRAITIDDFYMCDHEVTQDEFKAVFPEGYTPYFASSPAEGEVQGNRPAEMLTWYDAIAYCNKRSVQEGLTPCYTIPGVTDVEGFLWDNFAYSSIPTDSNTTWDGAVYNSSANGYRLPTEIEWEYAARGGEWLDDFTYSGNNDIDEVAWYNENSLSKPHEVKKKSPNKLGLYDMTGNIFEWCWDWYNDSIFTSTPGTGNASGSARISRGGSYSNGASVCTVANRFNGEPYARSDASGFRVVRSRYASYTHEIYYENVNGTFDLYSSTKIDGVIGDMTDIARDSTVVPSGIDGFFTNEGSTANTPILADCSTVVKTYIKRFRKSITITGGTTNGSITGSPTEAIVGATVTLTSTPNYGYISYWSSSSIAIAEPYANSITFVMPNEDITVNVINKIAYTINVTGCTSNKELACKDMTVTLTANTASSEGYYNDWTLTPDLDYTSVDEYGDSITFTMPSQNVTVVCELKEEEIVAVIRDN